MRKTFKCFLASTHACMDECTHIWAHTQVLPPTDTTHTIYGLIPSSKRVILIILILLSINDLKIFEDELQSDEFFY